MSGCFIHVWSTTRASVTDASLAHPSPCLPSEIEMVIMKLGKLSEVATAGASVQGQNTTDEEKSAATSSENAQWSR